MNKIEVQESHLRSDDDVLFGEAAAKCKYGAGYCQSDGYCWAQGECFNTLTHTEALAKIDDLENKLSIAMSELNHIKNSNNYLIFVLEENIKRLAKSKSEQYLFSVKYVLNIVKNALSK